MIFCIVSLKTVRNHNLFLEMNSNAIGYRRIARIFVPFSFIVLKSRRKMCIIIKRYGKTPESA